VVTIPLVDRLPTSRARRLGRCHPHGYFSKLAAGPTAVNELARHTAGKPPGRVATPPCAEGRRTRHRQQVGNPPPLPVRSRGSGTPPCPLGPDVDQSLQRLSSGGRKRTHWERSMANSVSNELPNKLNEAVVRKFRGGTGADRSRLQRLRGNTWRRGGRQRTTSEKLPSRPSSSSRVSVARWYERDSSRGNLCVLGQSPGVGPRRIAARRRWPRREFFPMWCVAGHHASMCSTKTLKRAIDRRLYAHGLTYDGFVSNLFGSSFDTLFAMLLFPMVSFFCRRLKGAEGFGSTFWSKWARRACHSLGSNW